MNRQQSEWNVFGHVLTTSELSMYIFMAATFACGVASIWPASSSAYSLPLSF